MFGLGRLRNDYDHWTTSQRFANVYGRFSAFTMISKQDYINTMHLAGRVKGIEGCVVECGVWKGGMAAGLVSVLGKERKYFLFDSFRGLPPAKNIDGPAAKAWQANTKGPGYFDNCRASL